MLHTGKDDGMTTEKQIAANRKNALASTGPATPEGKARSARNALKHGLRAQQVLIAGEEERVFKQMQEALFAELAPEGELEAFLAARVVAGMWRLNRVPRLEQELFSQPFTIALGRESGPGAVFRAEARSGADSFTRLSRYEQRIERGLLRALHELQRLQAVRTGPPLGVPQAIDLLLSAPEFA
jgi:hypothetical protein